MQYVRRLAAVWSWLPAFRAVAETQHLPSAARELAVVPSSLSRAVRLLEAEVGVPLFDRVGKRLVLNDAGRVLLRAVRDAMRELDDAIGAAAADSLRGSVVAVAAPDLAAVILAPASIALAAEHPELAIGVEAARERDALGLLLRGDADVAVVVRPPIDDELRVSAIGRWGRAAYAASCHPLARGRVDRERLAGTRSVIAEDDDGWPADLPRSVAVRVADERAALDACAGGELVAVAYDTLAAPLVRAHRVVQLAAPAIPARPLYLVHRRPVTEHRRTDALAAAIVRTVAASSAHGSPRERARD